MTLPHTASRPRSRAALLAAVTLGALLLAGCCGGPLGGWTPCLDACPECEAPKPCDRCDPPMVRDAGGCPTPKPCPPCDRTNTACWGCWGG